MEKSEKVYGNFYDTYTHQTQKTQTGSQWKEAHSVQGLLISGGSKTGGSSLIYDNNSTNKDTSLAQTERGQSSERDNGKII